MERKGENSFLSFRQFLVDMYAKIKTQRLKFICNNQKKIRSEDYVHLKDAIRNADDQVSELGKMVVLLQSFTGGPCYMH